MSIKEKRKRRIRLKLWQKLLLILTTTGLVVLAAWLYCERFAAVSYVDTMRATLSVEKSAMDEMKSQTSEFVEDVLDIRAALSDELGKPGSKEEKGRYYKLITKALESEGIAATPSKLFDLIKNDYGESPDDAHQVIRIRLDNKGNGKMADHDFSRLVLAAGPQLGVLIFGEPASQEQMTLAFSMRGSLHEGVSGTKNPANYEDGDYAWIEADPADETLQSSVWVITATVSRDAIDALPNRGSFYNKHLDLQNLLTANMTDDDYRQIAADAGVSAGPADLRKRLAFSLTNDECVVNVDAAWTGGQEEAKKLAVAAANRAAAVIFRTMLNITDAEEIRYRYNADELNGTFAPYTCTVISNAGAFTQPFFSQRPQFITDMALRDVAALQLDLPDFFALDTDSEKGGKSTSFFKDLAEAWQKKALLPEQAQDAYTALAGLNSLYSLTEEDVRGAIALTGDSADATGRTVLIRIDTAALTASLAAQAEAFCDGEAARLQSEVAQDLLADAQALLENNKAAVLGAIPQLADTFESSFLSRLDQVFFGYAADTDSFRTVSKDENGAIRYTVTEAGIEALNDGCFTQPVSLDPAQAIQNIQSEDASRSILAGADTAGPADVLRDSLSWHTDAGLSLDVRWSDKTTTAAVGKAALNVLSKELTGQNGGHPVRLIAGSSEVLREQVREHPPATLPAMVFAGLIALALSFIIFSQQSIIDSLITIFFVLFTFICVFPFYYLFINTISDNSKVASGQVNFVPTGIHFRNYQRILQQPELGSAILVTVSRTIIGTILMVVTSAWAGYLVTKQKMWHRSFWYRALVITMYFNAGLIPWYTNMMMLGLTNSFLAYIIPGMVAPYNIILVKTYIESIPGSLEESAIIDGASTFKVFMRIIMPLSVPILATIAIFGAVGNWNSFQDSLLLMSVPNLYTLQHRLYIYLNQTTAISTEQISEQMAQNLLNNGVTTKYTIAMVTIIPILLVYPLMQRYFVKGIMLGAVKG